MQRRLLIISINYHPELTGIGKYTGEMAKWFHKQGYAVRVITAPPYYPSWRTERGYKARRYIREQRDGVDIIRCPLWVPQNPNGLKRLIHLASFAVTSFWISIWSGIIWRPNWVFTIEPPLFSAPAALLTARLGGAKACLHIQDFEVDAAFELGLLNIGNWKHFFYKLESILIKKFDMLSTISEKMLNHLKKKNIPENKLVFFPNWVDTDFIYPCKNNSPLKKELGIPDNTKVALYSGNMNLKQGLEILISCVIQLSCRNDLIFLFCGDGPSRRNFENNTQHLRNVIFLPLQPIGRLNGLLNLADIHLLPQKVGASDLVMPSKLTGMFASGRPVVATAEPDTIVAQLVKSCGKVVPPGDAKSMAESIEWLLDNENKAKALGKAGRKYAIEKLPKERILKQFERDLIALCLK